MNLPTRTFVDAPATREHVPLFIGIMGPSGSGKTWSALRLATGIQSVVGGDVIGVDTEARRMLHYADFFKFRHIDFKGPFGSLDYLGCIRHCVARGAKIIIVDSMSHEHTGDGGYLQTQDVELNRMAGDDYAKRERVKMASWIKPAALRRQMIDGLLQLNANFIFCFRAREKVKPMKIGGKTEIVELGFMPIAGEDLLFEMTVNCLLLPQAGGVPTWRSDNVGERQMIKPAKQFDDIFKTSKPLDEDIGRRLAEWARGGTASAPLPQALATPRSHEQVPPAASAPAPIPGPQLEGAGDADENKSEMAAQYDAELGAAAELGTRELGAAWTALPKHYQNILARAKDRRHKPRAAEVDASKKGVEHE